MKKLTFNIDSLDEKDRHCIALLEKEKSERENLISVKDEIIKRNDESKQRLRHEVNEKGHHTENQQQTTSTLQQFPENSLFDKSYQSSSYPSFPVKASDIRTFFKDHLKNQFIPLFKTVQALSKVYILAYEDDEERHLARSKTLFNDLKKLLGEENVLCDVHGMKRTDRISFYTQQLPTCDFIIVLATKKLINAYNNKADGITNAVVTMAFNHLRDVRQKAVCYYLEDINEKNEIKELFPSFLQDWKYFYLDDEASYCEEFCNLLIAFQPKNKKLKTAIKAYRKTFDKQFVSVQQSISALSIGMSHSQGYKISQQNELLSVPLLLTDNDLKDYEPIKISTENDEKPSVLPEGESSIRDILTKNKLYVDKSHFVKWLVPSAEINKETDSLQIRKVQVFTRPKRFGKTMALSMIEHFFAQTTTGEPTASLFKKYANQLKITDEEKFLSAHQGKYSVIKIDLKSLKGEKTSDEFSQSLINIMADVYDRFKTNILSEVSDWATNIEKETERDKFIKALKGKVKKTQAKYLLKWLTELITKHNQRAHQRTNLDIWAVNTLKDVKEQLKIITSENLKDTFYLFYIRESEAYYFYGRAANGKIINDWVKNINALSCIESELPVPLISMGLEYKKSLHKLVLWALEHAAYYIQPIVLIDEFDSALNEIKEEGFWNDARQLLSSFFENGLKSNDDNFAFAVITGITSVKDGGLFSGWNNVDVNSVLDKNFNTFFGFTEAELQEIVSRRRVAKDVYNQLCHRFGFIFCGDQRLIHPWCVSKALGQLDKLNNLMMDFLNAPEDASLVNDIIQLQTVQKESIYEKIKKLLNNELINIPILPFVSYMKRKNSELSDSFIETWFFSLMVHCGYLTVLPTTFSTRDSQGLNNENKRDNNRLLVIIPNLTAYSFFFKILYPNENEFFPNQFKSRELLLKEMVTDEFFKNIIERIVNSRSSNIEVLSTCALLHNESIPNEILQFVFGQTASLSNFISDFEKEMMSHTVLMSHTLFKVDQKNDIFFDKNLHKQIVESYKLKAKIGGKQIEQQIEQVLTYLENQFMFDEHKVETYVKSKRYFLHVEHFLDLLKEMDIQLHMSKVQSLQYTLSRYYLYMQTDCKKASDLLDPLKKKRLPKNIHEAWVISNIGKALYYDNQFDNAAKYFTFADKHFAESGDAFTQDRARNQTRLAGCYYLQGKYSKALGSFGIALVLYKASGSNFSIAFIYLVQVQCIEIKLKLRRISPDKAFDDCREILDKCQQKDISEHRIIIIKIKSICLNIFAMLTALSDKNISYYEEKYIKLQEEVQKNLKELYGESHIRVAKFLIEQLATFSYWDYEAHCKQIETILTSIFKTSERYSHARFHLIRGQISYEEGRPGQALSYLQTAERIYHALFGTNMHRDLLTIYSLMGNAYRYLGELDKAILYFKQGQLLADTFAKDDDPVAENAGVIFINKLGEIALQKGQFDDAKSYFEQVQEKYTAGRIESQMLEPLSFFAGEVNLTKLQFYRGNCAELYGNPERYYLKLNNLAVKAQNKKALADIAYELGELYLTSGDIKSALKCFQWAETWMKAYLELKTTFTNNKNSSVNENGMEIIHPFLASIYVSKSLAGTMLYGTAFKKEAMVLIEKAHASFTYFNWKQSPFYGRCLANMVSLKRKLLLSQYDFNQQHVSDKVTLATPNIQLLEEAEKIFEPVKADYLVDYTLVKLLLGIEYSWKEDYSKSLEQLEKAIKLLKEVQRQHVMLKELYFYSARAAFNQENFSSSRQYFEKFEAANHFSTVDALLQLINWLEINKLIGFVSLHHLEIILTQEKHLQVDLIKDARALESFRNALSEKEKQAILLAYETLLQNNYNKNSIQRMRQAHLLSVIMIVAYSLGYIDKARKYFKKLKYSLGNNEKEVFLQPFSLMAFIPSHPQAIIDVMKRLLDMSEKRVKKIDFWNHRSLYHNLMVLFHVKVCHMQLFGLSSETHKKKIETYFEKCQNLITKESIASSCPILASYTLIWLHHGQAEKIYDCLKKYKFTLPSDITDDVKLMYGITLKSYLPPLLRYLIEKEGCLVVNSIPLLAYSLGLCQIYFPKEDNYSLESIINYIKNYIMYFSDQSINYQLLIHLLILNHQEQDAEFYIEKLRDINHDLPGFLCEIKDYYQFLPEAMMSSKETVFQLHRNDSIDNLPVVAFDIKPANKPLVKTVDEETWKMLEKELRLNLDISLLSCFDWKININEDKVNIQLIEKNTIYFNKHMIANLYVEMAALISKKLSGNIKSLHIEINDLHLILRIENLSDFKKVKDMLQQLLIKGPHIHELIKQRQTINEPQFEISTKVSFAVKTLKNQIKEAISLGNAEKVKHILSENQDILKQKNFIEELIDHALIYSTYSKTRDEILKQLEKYPNSFFQSSLGPAYQGSLNPTDYVSTFLKNEKTVSGFTVLHLAALGGHVELVKKLLFTYLPPQITDNEGLTSAFLARLRGHQNLANILDEATDNAKYADFAISDFIISNSIQEIVKNYIDSNDSRYFTLLLVGASATGKRTALRYIIHQFLNHSQLLLLNQPTPFVFRCHALNWHTLIKSYETLAERLGIIPGEVYEALDVRQLKKPEAVVEEQVALLHAKIQHEIQQKYSKWLMLYTDVKDVTMFKAIKIKNIQTNGWLIMSSENKDLLDISHDQLIKINMNLGLPQEQVKDQFTAAINQQSTHDLLKFFNEGTPAFVIKLVIRTLKNELNDVNNYLKNYEHLSKDQLFRNALNQLHLDYSWQKIFYTVLRLTCDVFTKDSSQSRLLLLKVSGILSPKKIPIEFLQRYFSQYLKVNNIFDDIYAAKKFGLVKLVEKEKYFHIHPAVQAFLRNFYSLDAENCTLLLNAMHYFYVNLIRDNQEACHEARVFHHHMKACHDFILTNNLILQKIDTLLIAQLSSDLGDFFHHSAHYEIAMKYHQHAFELRKDRLGPLNESTLASEYRITKVLYRQGQYKDAESRLKALITSGETVLGKENLVVADCYHLLGIVYMWQGKYPESISQYSYALELREKCLEFKDHHLIAQSYDALGEVYFFQGHYKEAYDALSRALPIFEKVLGEKHRDTTVCYNKLGLVSQKLNQYEKALSWHHQALVIASHLLGNSHQEIAYTCYNLGLLNDRIENHHEALHYFHRSLAVNIPLLGLVHPHTVTLYHQIANIYFKQAFYDKSEDLFKKAIELRTETLGEDNFYIAESRLGLGQVYLMCGKFSEAQKEFKRADDIYKKAIEKGNIHPASSEVITNRISFGLYYYVLGQCHKAIECYQEALNILLKNNSTEESRNELLRVYTCLCQVYYEMENDQEAMECLKKAKFYLNQNQISLDIAFNNKETLNVAEYQRTLGCVYYKQKEHASALECLNKSLRIKEKILPAQHPDIAIIWNNLGQVSTEIANFQIAITHHTKALTLLEKKFGKEHLEIAKSYDGIGEVYFGQGDFVKALYYFKKSFLIREKLCEKNHAYLALSHHNLGRAYQELEEGKNALQHYEACLKLCKVASVERVGLLIDCRITLGSLYTELLHQYSKAEAEYNEALRLCDNHMPEKSFQKAYIKVYIKVGRGEMYVKQKHYKKANIAFMLALNELGDLNKYTLDKANIKYKIAEMKAQQKFYQEGLNEAREILTLMYQTYSNSYKSYPITLQTFELLADIENKLQDYKSAHEHYVEIRDYYEKSNFSDEASYIDKKIKIYNELANLLFKRLKNDEEALIYYLKQYEVLIRKSESKKDILLDSVYYECTEKLKYFEAYFFKRTSEQNKMGALQNQFQDIERVYHIQCALYGEHHETTRQTKIQLEQLGVHIKTLPIIEQFEKGLQQAFKSVCIFYVESGCWQELLVKPTLLVSSINGISEARQYILQEEITKLTEGKILFLVTVVSAEEFTITGIRWIKSQSTYKAIHVDVSHRFQALAKMIETFFKTLQIPLEKCMGEYFYAQMDIDFASKVIQAIVQLDNADFRAINLWKKLLDIGTLGNKFGIDYTQEHFSTVVRRIEMLNALSSVIINEFPEKYSKNYLITNFFCNSLMLVIPSQTMDELFERHSESFQLQLIIYGELNAGHLELARQICNVRLYSLPSASLWQSKSHIQWIVDCENEPAFRFSLENLLATINDKELFPSDSMNVTSLIAHLFTSIGTFADKHHSSYTVHLSLIFNNIQNLEWIDKITQYAEKQLSKENNQCTLLFLIETQKFNNLRKKHPGYFKKYNLPPQNVKSCIHGKRNERINESNISLHRLNEQQQKMLAQVALFVTKPLKKADYINLVMLLLDEQNHLSWDILQDILIEQHLMEYDDVEKGPFCRYYLIDALRNNLLKTNIYRDTQEKYSLPKSYDIMKEASRFHLLHEAFINLLITLAKKAQELLLENHSYFTRSQRQVFIITFIKEVTSKNVLPIDITLGSMDETQLRDCLEKILDELYKEKLAYALRIHDFLTIDQIVQTRFAKIPFYLLKRIWALIKMGHLSSNKHEIESFIDQIKPLGIQNDPLLYLEYLVVLGIKHWYEGDVDALQNDLQSIEQFNPHEQNALKKDFHWQILQSEVLLLKLRSYRFFIDINPHAEARMELYVQGDNCFHALKNLQHFHFNFQLPEIYLERALLASADKKWSEHLRYLKKADEALNNKQLTDNYPVRVEIFKQLSMEYCRQGNIKKAYNYCIKAIDFVELTFNHYQKQKPLDLLAHLSESKVAMLLLAKFKSETNEPIHFKTLEEFDSLPEEEKITFLLESYWVAFMVYHKGLFGEKSPNTVRAIQAAKDLYLKYEWKEPKYSNEDSFHQELIQQNVSSLKYSVTQIFMPPPPKATKVRMQIQLSESSEQLMYDFQQNSLGSEITKPLEFMAQPLAEHWYNNDEIEKLLTFYLGQRKDIQIITPIDAYHLEGNTLIANLYDQQLQQVFQESITYEETLIKTIIVPINLGQQHWSALYIQYTTADRTKPMIGYFDPLGSSMPDPIMKAIHTVYHSVDMSNILISPIRLQKDTYNCGPWIVEILRQLVTTGELPAENFNINIARQIHEADLAETKQERYIPLHQI